MDAIFGSPLTDALGRTIRYLRLSITDRCNLRCVYCRGGFETFIPHESILRYEEMEQLVELAVDLGVQKLRITGGEPLVRRDFLDFLERLRLRHPSLDIRLTSNGTLLGPAVPRLKELGVNAVNLSLDTFDRKRFELLTGRDLLPQVLASMEELLKAQLPFKINVVGMRGVNDEELPLFLDYALHNPVEVRFIEFMPMGEGTCWSSEKFWSADAILAAVRRDCLAEPLMPDRLAEGPARSYLLTKGNLQGRLGLISPLSHHFCASCNRLRLTAEGALRTCLYEDREYRLRGALRHPRLGIKAVRRIMELAVLRKPLGFSLLEARAGAVAGRRMHAIGG